MALGPIPGAGFSSSESPFQAIHPCRKQLCSPTPFCSNSSAHMLEKAFSCKHQDLGNNSSYVQEKPHKTNPSLKHECQVCCPSSVKAH